VRGVTSQEVLGPQIPPLQSHDGGLEGRGGGVFGHLQGFPGTGPQPHFLVLLLLHVSAFFSSDFSHSGAPLSSQFGPAQHPGPGHLNDIVSGSLVVIGGMMSSKFCFSSDFLHAAGSSFFPLSISSTQLSGVFDDSHLEQSVFGMGRIFDSAGLLFSVEHMSPGHLNV